MNQMTTYILVMCGLTLLFYVMGLTPTNPMLNLVLAPQSMSTSTFVVTILVALTSVSGIIFGFVSRNVEIQAMSAVLPILVTVLWCFTEVIIRVAAYSTLASALLFGPMILLFVMTAVEYWRGRD